MDDHGTANTALTRLNDAPDAVARLKMLACCHCDEWASAVLAARPYRSPAELLERAAQACRDLSDAGLEQALASHPRIGDRPTARGTDVDHSQREQAAVTGADDEVKVRLRGTNAAYERRFDRVFLIRAAGRGPQEILAEAERRLRNDPEVERTEVLEQLAEITRLRLQEHLSP